MSSVRDNEINTERRYNDATYNKHRTSSQHVMLEKGVKEPEIGQTFPANDHSSGELCVPEGKNCISLQRRNISNNAGSSKHKGNTDSDLMFSSSADGKGTPYFEKDGTLEQPRPNLKSSILEKVKKENIQASTEFMKADANVFQELIQDMVGVDFVDSTVSNNTEPGFHDITDASVPSDEAIESRPILESMQYTQTAIHEPSTKEEQRSNKKEIREVSPHHENTTQLTLIHAEAYNENTQTTVTNKSCTVDEVDVNAPKMVSYLKSGQEGKIEPQCVESMNCEINASDRGDILKCSQDKSENFTSRLPLSDLRGDCNGVPEGYFDQNKTKLVNAVPTNTRSQFTVDDTDAKNHRQERGGLFTDNGDSMNISLTSNNKTSNPRYERAGGLLHEKKKESVKVDNKSSNRWSMVPRNTGMDRSDTHENKSSKKYRCPTITEVDQSDQHAMKNDPSSKKNDTPCGSGRSQPVRIKVIGCSQKKKKKKKNESDSKPSKSKSSHSCSSRYEGGKTEDSKNKRSKSEDSVCEKIRFPKRCTPRCRDESCPGAIPEAIPDGGASDFFPGGCTTARPNDNYSGVFRRISSAFGGQLQYIACTRGRFQAPGNVGFYHPDPTITGWLRPCLADDETSSSSCCTSDSECIKKEKKRPGKKKSSKKEKKPMDDPSTDDTGHHVAPIDEDGSRVDKRPGRKKEKRCKKRDKKDKSAGKQAVEQKQDTQDLPIQPKESVKEVIEPATDVIVEELKEPTAELTGGKELDCVRPDPCQKLRNRELEKLICCESFPDKQSSHCRISSYNQQKEPESTSPCNKKRLLDPCDYKTSPKLDCFTSVRNAHTPFSCRKETDNCSTPQSKYTPHYRSGVGDNGPPKSRYGEAELNIVHRHNACESYKTDDGIRSLQCFLQSRCGTSPKDSVLLSDADHSPSYATQVTTNRMNSLTNSPPRSLSRSPLSPYQRSCGARLTNQRNLFTIPQRGSYMRSLQGDSECKGRSMEIYNRYKHLMSFDKPQNDYQSLGPQNLRCDLPNREFQSVGKPQNIYQSLAAQNLRCDSPNREIQSVNYNKTKTSEDAAIKSKKCQSSSIESVPCQRRRQVVSDHRKRCHTPPEDESNASSQYTRCSIYISNTPCPSKNMVRNNATCGNRAGQPILTGSVPSQYHRTVETDRFKRFHTLPEKELHISSKYTKPCGTVSSASTPSRLLSTASSPSRRERDSCLKSETSDARHTNISFHIEKDCSMKSNHTSDFSTESEVLEKSNVIYSRLSTESGSHKSRDKQVSATTKCRSKGKREKDLSSTDDTTRCCKEDIESSDTCDSTFSECQDTESTITRCKDWCLGLQNNGDSKRKLRGRISISQPDSVVNRPEISIENFNVKIECPTSKCIDYRVDSTIDSTSNKRIHTDRYDDARNPQFQSSTVGAARWQRNVDCAKRNGQKENRTLNMSPNRGRAFNGSNNKISSFLQQKIEQRSENLKAVKKSRQNIDYFDQVITPEQPTSLCKMEFKNIAHGAFNKRTMKNSSSVLSSNSEASISRAKVQAEYKHVCSFKEIFFRNNLTRSKKQYKQGKLNVFTHDDMDFGRGCDEDVDSTSSTTLLLSNRGAPPCFDNNHSSSAGLKDIQLHYDLNIDMPFNFYDKHDTPLRSPKSVDNSIGLTQIVSGEQGMNSGKETISVASISDNLSYKRDSLPGYETIKENSLRTLLLASTMTDWPIFTPESSCDDISCAIEKHSDSSNAIEDRENCPSHELVNKSDESTRWNLEMKPIVNSSQSDEKDIKNHNIQKDSHLCSSSNICSLGNGLDTRVRSMTDINASELECSSFQQEGSAEDGHSVDRIQDRLSSVQISTDIRQGVSLCTQCQDLVFGETNSFRQYCDRQTSTETEMHTTSLDDDEKRNASEEKDVQGSMTLAYNSELARMSKVLGQIKEVSKINHVDMIRSSGDCSLETMTLDRIRFHKNNINSSLDAFAFESTPNASGNNLKNDNQSSLSKIQELSENGSENGSVCRENNVKPSFQIQDNYKDFGSEFKDKYSNEDSYKTLLERSYGRKEKTSSGRKKFPQSNSKQSMTEILQIRPTITTISRTLSLNKENNTLAKDIHNPHSFKSNFMKKEFDRNNMRFQLHESYSNEDDRANAFIRMYLCQPMARSKNNNSDDTFRHTSSMTCTNPDSNTVDEINDSTRTYALTAIKGKSKGLDIQYKLSFLKSGKPFFRAKPWDYPFSLEKDIPVLSKNLMEEKIRFRTPLGNWNQNANNGLENKSPRESLSNSDSESDDWMVIDRVPAPEYCSSISSRCKGINRSQAVLDLPALCQQQELTVKKKETRHDVSNSSNVKPLRKRKVKAVTNHPPHRLPDIYHEDFQFADFACKNVNSSGNVIDKSPMNDERDSGNENVEGSEDVFHSAEEDMIPYIQRVSIGDSWGAGCSSCRVDICNHSVAEGCTRKHVLGLLNKSDCLINHCPRGKEKLEAVKHCQVLNHSDPNALGAICFSNNRSEQEDRHAFPFGKPAPEIFLEANACQKRKPHTIQEFVNWYVNDELKGPCHLRAMNKQQELFKPMPSKKVDTNTKSEQLSTKLKCLSDAEKIDRNAIGDVQTSLDKTNKSVSNGEGKEKHKSGEEVLIESSSSETADENSDDSEIEHFGNKMLAGPVHKRFNKGIPNVSSRDNIKSNMNYREHFRKYKLPLRRQLSKIKRAKVVISSKKKSSAVKAKLNKKNIKEEKREHEIESPSLEDIEVALLEKERVRFACNKDGEWAEVGRGSYGCVYLGLLDNTDEVAIKDFYESNSYDHVIHEARMLVYLQDTDITPKFYGLRRRFDVTKMPGEYCIIMEYFGDGKTLFGVLSDKIELRISEWVDVLGQLVAGLRLIHRKNVLLNDLKADNILIDLKGGRKTIRYIDVGMATHKQGLTFQLPQNKMGKYNFLAPEVREGYHTSKRSDIYSLGYMLDQILRVAGPALSGLEGLVSSCMSDNPKKRPAVGEIVATVHEFMANGPDIKSIAKVKTMPMSNSI